MNTIGAFEAKTHLSDLLERVTRGESFVITKRGKPVAALSPLTESTQHGPKELIENFRRQYAKSLTPFSLEEIGDIKAAGRR